MRKPLMSKLFVLTLVGCLLGIFPVHAQKVLDKVQQNYKGIEALRIEGGFCDVAIDGQSRDDVDFEGVIQGRFFGSGDFKIIHKKEGTLLHVWIDRPSISTGNIEGKLIFEVPATVNVNVVNSSGDVKIKGIKKTPMKVKASSGDIYLERNQCDLIFGTSSGDLIIKEHKGQLEGVSSSGDQQFWDIQGDIKTKASSGDVSFSRIHGNINSGTTSGDVDFKEVKGDVSNVSSSGEIYLRNCEGSFSLRATSGDIDGKGITLRENSRFKTSSGDITMDFSNDLETISFDLVASSGDLQIGNRSAEKRMKKQSGEISVNGVSSSGDQRYY